MHHAERRGSWGNHGFPHVEKEEGSVGEPWVPPPSYPWIEAMIGMIRIATMFAILIIGLIAGPAVSL